MYNSELVSKRNRYRVWLEQSNYDLIAAQNSMDSKDYEWSCYQSIQCVEKSLKAVIVHGGFLPPRTHKLGVLISMANRANKRFEKVSLDSFRKIESYTFISRYPFVMPGQNSTPHEMIKQNDAEVCLRIAQSINKKINKFIKSNFASELAAEFGEIYFTEDEIDKRLDNVRDLLEDCEMIKVKRVVLFGSFARDKERPRSATMDLLIVGNTDMKFIERIEFVRTLTKGYEPIIEPVVYTPEEFDTLLNDEGEGFLESALDEGIDIFNSV